MRVAKQISVTAKEQTSATATILKCVTRLALWSEYDIGQKLISVKAIKATPLSGIPTTAVAIAIREIFRVLLSIGTDPQQGGIIDADEPLEAQLRSGLNLTDQRYFDVGLAGMRVRAQNQKERWSLAEVYP